MYKTSYRMIKDIKFIFWQKEAKNSIVTTERFKEIYDDYSKTKTKIPFTTVRKKYQGNTFSVRKDGDIYYLYTYDTKYKYISYSTDSFDNDKNKQRQDGDVFKGGDAISNLFRKFVEFEDSTFKNAFDTVPEEYKRCIPKQFAYVNPDYFNRVLRLSSVDACSQYPSNMMGRLPNAHASISIVGRVQPTKDYPFAFYIKSGHLAEYGAFDTHNWCIDKIFMFLFRFGKESWAIQNVDDKEEITVLMKASEYTLDKCWDYFYNVKETYPHDSEEYKAAKLTMNGAIGMMHTKKYETYRYAHLVAVCIARSNQKILDLVNNQIGLENVVQICVDGIMYIGGAVGGNKRGLGLLEQEYTRKKAKISKYNKYIVMNDDGTVFKFKKGNCNRTVDGKEIIESDIKDLDEQYKWILDDPLKEIKNGG